MDRIEFIRENDRLIELFAMEVEEALEGFARVSASVEERFLNAHGIAHGGFITVVADVAFALCVNSVTSSVATQWNMYFQRPAKVGERVTAECRLVHRGRRMLIAEFQVTGPEGREVARGQATAMPVEVDAFADRPTGAMGPAGGS